MTVGRAVSVLERDRAVRFEARLVGWQEYPDEEGGERECDGDDRECGEVQGAPPA
jgi:hypothetical protein